MKNIMKFLIIVLAVIFLNRISLHISNYTYDKKYNNENYNINVSQNFPYSFFERYKNYYNLGNLNYKLKLYNTALSNFEKSLNSNPSADDECKVRINLVLSLINTLDLEDEKSKEENIEKLEQGKTILNDNSCLNDEELSEPSDDLSEDIDELLEELENSSDESSEGEPDSGEFDESDLDIDEQELMERLEEYQNGATGSKSETVNIIENAGSEYEFGIKFW